MTADDLGRWTTYLGGSGWTVLDENGSALILTRSDNADSEARAVADTFNDLAAEVRRLRDEVGKWQSTALLRASDAARAQEERDALGAAARDVIEWWDDDERGGTAEINTLRALVAPDPTSPTDTTETTR